MNSKYIIDVNQKIENAIKGGLKKIGNENLSQNYQTFLDVNNKREYHMLNEIYKYYKSHKFGKAIFTIGSAHRNSIIIKINKNENSKLNWIY